MKQIAILGSTGSIGTQTLEVIENLQQQYKDNNSLISYDVLLLSTNTRTDILLTQINKFNPKFVAVTDKIAYEEFSKSYSGNTKIVFGINGILEIIKSEPIDYLVNSLVGNIGLKPTITAIEQKINIGLANKEVLVTCGEFIMNMARENDVTIYPIDSEHSAIYQCLQGNAQNKIDKIFLTCSGGPFRGHNIDELKDVTKFDALRHPNWEMGQKITIDSSTLMNKGLEVIEARWLFDIEPKNIEVVVHKESIIHSMVQYEDGSIMAQLGTPDMKLPISYALTYPNRYNYNFPKLNIFDKNLSFERPDLISFKCLALAYEALELGGLAPAVLNSANEVLVALFLDEEIEFLDIPKYVELCLNKFKDSNLEYNLENVYKIIKETKSFVTLTLNE